jgi:acyl carrier protein
MQNVVSEVAKIREIVAQHGRLSVNVRVLKDHDDLYDVGLTSLATVGIMVAIEDHFNVEFAESMLRPSTFESLEAIADAVAELLQESPHSLVLQ